MASDDGDETDVVPDAAGPAASEATPWLFGNPGTVMNFNALMKLVGLFRAMISSVALTRKSVVELPESPGAFPK